jgi:CBS domain-containing protein
MKVQDIASRGVATCEPNTDLAAVGGLMWAHGCGIVPVVDPLLNLVGVLTDRDICIALTTRGHRAHELRAADVMMGRVEHCAPKDDVRKALDTMRRAHVRRLPVVDEQGRLEGVLSLDDIALVAKPNGGGSSSDVSYEDVARTLQELDRRNVPVATKAEPTNVEVPVEAKASAATAAGTSTSTRGAVRNR